MSDHLATVSTIYSAFGKGDVPAILAHVADDVRWEDFADNSAHKAGVPYLIKRTGKAGVGEFFKAVGAMKITEFQVLGLMAGGNKVVAEIAISVETPGGLMRDEELHLWTFDAAGKVSNFRHYVDTAKHIAAAKQA